MADYLFLGYNFSMSIIVKSSKSSVRKTIHHVVHIKFNSLLCYCIHLIHVWCFDIRTISATCNLPFGPQTKQNGRLSIAPS